MSLSVNKKMEVLLYNSNICRLCGEENENGTLLYLHDENNQNLSEVINTYLPIKVADDGELPRTICPGCTIQLEATVEFLNLIINGQKVIRQLHLKENNLKKNINSRNDQEITNTALVYEVNTSGEVYQADHPISLQVGALEKPKRKRGRPPKKHKSPEEIAVELTRQEEDSITKTKNKMTEEPTGKRRRKTPTRFKEAVQGKELEKIFIEEGVIEVEPKQTVKPNIPAELPVPVSKEPEIIGHKEDSGELVVVIKGKGRGRPKGRMRQMCEECAICGLKFSCAGRYMSHIAQHGPVLYQCAPCAATFSTKLHFNTHQKKLEHSGLNVIPCESDMEQIVVDDEIETADQSTEPSKTVRIELKLEKETNEVSTLSDLPELDPLTETASTENKQIIHPNKSDETQQNAIVDEVSPSFCSSDVKKSDVIITEKPNETESINNTSDKGRLKCNQCDKTFSTRQSKSMHIKATHMGERPYVCKECGAKFPYPRSLTLHSVTHRRRRTQAKMFACDLCGKVLNHPSSVVYHKEAEHAGQRYVCNKCGKTFKHKQLLQRHQLVHSKVRPYTCKTCDSTFKTKANLLNHQLLHTGVKKFSCEICKQKFAHKTSLTLHMRWHTGQKPFSCETCGKRFSQKGNLAEHERIHTGEKPFQCSVCTRRFTTSSQHRLHMLRHGAVALHTPARTGAGRTWPRRSNARPHVCSVCGRTFTDRWALHKHMRAHTGERPFRCAHCPRAFADPSNLNKHKKQVHKQMSLLAPTSQLVVTEPASTPPSQLTTVEEVSKEELEESVIYVTYNVDDENAPAFHILDPQQAANLDESNVLTSCELYSGTSLLVPQPELEQLGLDQQQLEDEQLEQVQLDHGQLQNPLVLDTQKCNIPVTDEQGNPLHFTMQDGTQLAITSSDGKSLQVITEDGETIPVEINGYADEEEIESRSTIDLNLQKALEQQVTTPVTHYFTIV